MLSTAALAAVEGIRAVDLSHQVAHPNMAAMAVTVTAMGRLLAAAVEPMA